MSKPLLKTQESISKQPYFSGSKFESMVIAFVTLSITSIIFYAIFKIYVQKPLIRFFKAVKKSYLSFRNAIISIYKYVLFHFLLNKVKWLIISNKGYFRTSHFEKILEASFNQRFEVEKNSLASKNLLNYKNKRNNKFKKQEIKRLKSVSPFYQTLTDEQIAAVVTEEDRNLVVAGAGSGKTRVIQAKVKYLIDEKLVNPEKILVLSFTNLSANELKEKIQSVCEKGIPKVSTIHSFALSIIKRNVSGNLKLNNNISLLVYKSFLNALKFRKNRYLFLNFCKYFFEHSKPLYEYRTIEQMRKALNLEKNSSYVIDDLSGEILFGKMYKTLKGEKVRSVDERFIANFLYINEIAYEYERQYPFVGQNYKPDFYLPEYDIYWEHFAFDKDLKAPSIFPDPRQYELSVQWKRKLHKDKKTKLIETYSGYLNAGDSTTYLEDFLLKHDILAPEFKSERSSNANIISEEIVKMMEEFYNRFLIEGHSVHEIDSFVSDHGAAEKAFWSFFKVLLDLIENEKNNSNEITFIDMIINAEKFVTKSQSDYLYIIIDEFQDTNKASINLLESTFGNSKDCVLMAVGDDWQSIYGFAGSDFQLLQNYRSKENSETTFLVNNFRSSPEIVELGKRFITINENQIFKNVKSASNITDAVVKFIKLDELKSLIETIPKEETIFFLGRYKKDIPEDYIKNLIKQGYKNIHGMTIHQSKGLESDNVIFIFPDEQSHYFPSRIPDPVIYKILNIKSEEFLNAEERRLMYVAISRAKKRLFIVSPFKDCVSSSPFWQELIEIHKNIGNENKTEVKSGFRILEKFKKFLPSRG